jgi:hypothetical protein
MYPTLKNTPLRTASFWGVMPGSSIGQRGQRSDPEEESDSKDHSASGKHGQVAGEKQSECSTPSECSGSEDERLAPSGALREDAAENGSRKKRTANRAELPDNLVLYCERHDYGTRVLKKTGNLAAVMKTMGHKDVKTAMQY